MHLGGVLAGEGASSVGSPAAVGVNDDLAASQAGISVRSANHKATLTQQKISSISRFKLINFDSLPMGSSGRRSCRPSIPQEPPA